MATMRKADGNDSPRAGKRPRLSDEVPSEEPANVAQSDSFSDGWFGSEIDFDDATLQAVDDYDVFQPDMNVTCVARSGDDPFLKGGHPEDEEEVPSSQGEADGGEYAIGKVHGDYLSSQSEARDASPTFRRVSNLSLASVPSLLPPKETEPLPDDTLDDTSTIDFGAYVSIPDAVGFTSAEAMLSDPSLPTFMPASQVPISDRGSTAISKPVVKLNIKLAGGGGAIKPITAEEIKLSANRLMAYQQDTKWKPQTRSRNMPPPVASARPFVPPVQDSNPPELDENIDFGALVKPTIGLAGASVDYDDGMPIFMPASQVPIDRSELASTSASAKPTTKSNIQLAGGSGGLKPLTEDEIKMSAEKLMSYQQDTKWKPQVRTRLSRLTSGAASSRIEDPPSTKLDLVDADDSGVGLLEPVEGPDTPTDSTGKGKQRAMLPHGMSPLRGVFQPLENLNDLGTVEELDDTPGAVLDGQSTRPVVPLRMPENPFSARPSLGTPVRSTPLFSTPIRPPRFSAQTPSEVYTQAPLFSQSTSQAVPSTLYRLGLSQRKPNKGSGFTTPFKPGMAPGEKGREMLRGTPVRSNGVPTPLGSATPFRTSRGGAAGITGITRALEAEKEKQILERAVFDTRSNGERKTLHQAGFVPTGNRDSSVPYLSLKAASAFSFPQGGHTEILKALQDRNCTLADNEWVKNHWGQVVWKLSGLARSGAPEAKEKWSWDEALRQMLYRYEREINRAERPAIRRIQEHDASPAQSMVLCVSCVQIGNDEVEIELTDGWYRIRTLGDKALARAAIKGKLAPGRKIAVTGARIEGSQEGKEVLKAYHSSTLKITGNSTSLARWDARLGFHRGPFIASLRSLSADGGYVALLDVIVTKLFPVGFVETDEKGRSTRPFDQSAEDDAQRAWEERRSNEASKWRIQLEKKLERMKTATGRFRHLAKGASFNVDETPEDAESFLEEFEDADYDPDMLKTRSFEPTMAAWLAAAIQAKCDETYERREEEMERELARACPPRKVRNFRVVVVKDARPLQKPAGRTAQLTAWDVLAFGADAMCVGQRYLLANVQPSQTSSWRKHDFGGDIYLSTRRDTKWTAISGA
ncbi:BRCA2, oligonucleotide/oligosaccharide-binding domain 1 protein [Rhizoctonia solani AG-3 Rhs1AP]|uniref:BRCA2, oligonucleotide/oligosaccharide-binding domain 1 protein n=1 Tax=Rhizoctonia solani AG-3 Rhs1AP TaxID=1086054 RepID=X8J657_9AGAM|nr:BRCA2, oligonucleotide/oligosaccharide-binding domain 1 protein [Rhizoctonia solani AG-3 Rhs1AP]